MTKISQYMHGDQKLWALILILSFLSLLPVYSASSNLEYVIGNQTAHQHLIKHIFFILIGFGIIFVLQNIHYKYIGGLSIILIFFFIVLLTITEYQARGHNSYKNFHAARWLKLPFIPAFQTSIFASLVLYIYLARQLSKLRKNIGVNWYPDFFIFTPILIIAGLIFPSNGSTGCIVFGMSVIILFIGGYPINRIMVFSFIFISVFTSFIIFVLMFPTVFTSHRVHTWKNRIETFFYRKNVEEPYQNQHAKAAIVHAGLLGQGPGKSALKQTLPQSSSDFIFAIIIEEYGYIGVFIVILIFLSILQRIFYISNHSDTFFGSMLTISVGLPIICQAFLNMLVTVNIIPITGQNLPILSLGGTSMCCTYFSFGIIISVSRYIK